MPPAKIAPSAPTTPNTIQDVSVDGLQIRKKFSKKSGDADNRWATIGGIQEFLDGVKHLGDNYRELDHNEVGFRVEDSIWGTENHNPHEETAARRITGTDRLLMGEQADELGPLRVFEKNVENANPKLLKTGNFTGCPTISALKAMADEYRQHRRLHHEYYNEVRVLSTALDIADVISEHVIDKFLVVDAPIDNYDESTEECDENNAVDEVNDPLGEVDDLEQPEVPIVHQSPFTCEANNQIPLLNTLLIDQVEPKHVTNSMYCKQIVKITYKWFAYLPMWSCILYQFDERYANDSVYSSTTHSLGAGRLSNATIGSYFAIIKESVLQRKTRLRPAECIAKIFRSTQARLKAGKYGVTQSAKGRKNSKKKTDVAITETWNRSQRKKVRGVYFGRVTKKQSLTKIQRTSQCKLVVPSQLKKRLTEEDYYDLKDDQL
ncbi:unnamed protein product, partial [Didymodactylos carnosus]